MNLIWLPQAQTDIQRLYDFLLERDPGAAERAIRGMQLGAQRLLELPRVGRAVWMTPRSGESCMCPLGPVPWRTSGSAPVGPRNSSMQDQPFNQGTQPAA
jgi:hypothetical protein